MTFDEIIVLLPCQSLDEFPSHLQASEAEGVLAAWSAIWHPALVAATGRLPVWRRADSMVDVSQRLIVVPAIAEPALSETALAEGIAAKAESSGGRLIRGLSHRPEIVAALLSALGEMIGGEPAAQQLAAQASVEPSLADDFLALGTCHLYGELLARRMRYGSTIDDARLQTHTVDAAKAAVAGNVETAKEELSLAFGVLLEARGRYYPVDSSLVDLTLVAATTLGSSLRKELSSATESQPINVMLSGDVLAEMAGREPASLTALREALDRETVSLVGGEVDEAELPLLEPESVLWNLRIGLAIYEKHLARRPVVYGRRRYGLTPILPQILFQLGFRGAVHFTLDDGRFPQADGGKARWEGLDVMGIDALSRVPLDVTQPAAMLGMAEKIGHAMDHDHVATISFAHWPAQGNMFYNDLRRAGVYAPVLGKFLLLDHYFAEGTSSGSYSKFTADQYRTPYLQQAIERGKPDPLSRWVRYRNRSRTADACQTLATLVSLLRQSDATDKSLRSEIERRQCLDKPPQDGEAEFAAAEADLDRRLDERLSAVVGQLSAAIPRDKSTSQRGYLVVNPASYKRRVLVDLPELTELPGDELPVLAAEKLDGKRRAIVEVPPVGFAWVAPGGKEPARAWSGDPIASSLLLRNEHCEVRIHPETGGIQSIHDYRARANRLSQQLVFRMPPKAESASAESATGDEAGYSRMVADSVEVTDSGRLLGEITSRGRLLDPENNLLAEFTQRVQMMLGSRVIAVEIELGGAANSLVPTRPDPWNSYYACRFAWAERGADLARDVHLVSQTTSAKRIEAPHFVEIQASGRRTAILSGGLPYHCRIGSRMLDTLLVVPGETARKFRIGLGIDLPHLSAAAIDFTAPAAMMVESAAAPMPARHSWLFHVDARNVIATHWEPIVAGENDAPADSSESASQATRLTAGAIIGFRVRLFEMEGRAGRVHLSAFRSPKTAVRTDFQGRSTGDLAIEGDRIALDLGGHEWMQLEAFW